MAPSPSDSQTLISADVAETALRTSGPAVRRAQSTRSGVADSWEDEAEELKDAEIGTDQESRVKSQSHNPMHDIPTTAASHDNDRRNSTLASSPHEDSSRRPEKSTAMASRLIAAGLGVKVTRTEDQRRYDKAVRSQARLQKEKELEAKRRKQEELEAAKKAIWDDG